MNTDQLIEFIGNHPIMVAAAVGLVVLLVGTEVARKFRGFKELLPADVVKLMNHENAVVIDVRDKGDFRAGHIVGAVNVPLSQIEERVSSVAGDKEQVVVAYCANGPHSGQAANKLKALGYTNINSLKGGLTAWRAENLPVGKK